MLQNVEVAFTTPDREGGRLYARSGLVARPSGALRVAGGFDVRYAERDPSAAAWPADPIVLALRGNALHHVYLFEDGEGAVIVHRNARSNAFFDGEVVLTRVRGGIADPPQIVAPNVNHISVAAALGPRGLLHLFTQERPDLESPASAFVHRRFESPGAPD